MKQVLLTLLCILSFMAYASAHATPVEFNPLPAEVRTTSIDTISIRFSEHLEESLSKLILYDPDNTPWVIPIRVPASDSKLLTTQVHLTEMGSYRVVWTAFSKDDGHLTTGEYIFSIQNQTRVQDQSSQDHTQHRSLQDVFFLFLQLASQCGILSISLFLILKKKSASVKDVQTAYRTLFYLTTILFIGALGLLTSKTLFLAKSLDSSFLFSLEHFVQTRIGLILLLQVILSIVLISLVYTHARPSRVFSLLSLCVLLTALASHAWSSSHPLFTTIISSLHLMSKELLLSTPLLYLLFKTSISRKDLKKSIIPFICILGCFISTGLYILFIDIASVQALYTTDWGVAFLTLAFFLLLFSFYCSKALTKIRKSLPVKRFEIYTLILLSLSILFITASLILTNPPRNNYEQCIARDTSVRLLLNPSLPQIYLLSLPDQRINRSLFVRAANEAEGIERVIQLKQVSPDLYSFQRFELHPPGAWEISVIIQEVEKYDEKHTLTLDTTKKESTTC